MAGVSPQEFVARWSHVALTEKAASHSHFIDLCSLPFVLHINAGQPQAMRDVLMLIRQAKRTCGDDLEDVAAFERGFDHG